MLLELERVDKRFGSKKALREVSFQVAEGEVVALAGKNGAGVQLLCHFSLLLFSLLW